MAHATDYQSRTYDTVYDSPHVRVCKQTVDSINNLHFTSGWSKQACKEYCLNVYKDMGLTDELFEKLYEYAKTH